MKRRTLLSALAAGTAAAATGAALPTEATAAAAKRRPRAKTGPVTVAYIEVNDHSMLNAGKYTLANSGAQVIDVAVIFAANINYDGTSAYLHFNDQVTNVLNNVATQVRPLQQKGIKVLLSILGNHQGAGFANFPDASRTSPTRPPPTRSRSSSPTPSTSTAWTASTSTTSTPSTATTAPASRTTSRSSTWSRRSARSCRTSSSRSTTSARRPTA